MHLADVLTEGRVCDHLAQEVEVRRHQRHDATADKHRHVLLISQSHVLHRPTTQWRTLQIFISINVCRVCDFKNWLKLFSVVTNLLYIFTYFLMTQITVERDWRHPARTPWEDFLSLSQQSYSPDVDCGYEPAIGQNPCRYGKQQQQKPLS